MHSEVLLGCDTVLLGVQFLCFKKSQCLYITVKQPKQFMLLALFDQENEGTTILSTVRNYTPDNTASYPRRISSSATPLREPQI